MIRTQTELTNDISQAARADPARVCRAILFLLAIYAGLVGAATCAMLLVLPAREGFEPGRVSPLFAAMGVHTAASIGAILGLLGMRRRRDVSRWLPRWLLVGGIVFAVVSIDLVVGVFFPLPDHRTPVLQPHATRGWSHRPNSQGNYFGMPTTINSLGLRGPDFPVGKAEGEIRILFVGDSITVGLGVDEEDTFIRQVEKILKADSPDTNVRTINAGCSGYTTWQEADYLKREGLRLSPDLVVLNFCLNDLLDVIDTQPQQVRGRPWIDEYPPLNHVSGLARMAAHFSDAHRAKVIREQRLWTNENVFGAPRGEFVGLDALFEHPPNPRIAAAWKRIFEDLGDFDEICRAADVPWVLLTLPIQMQLPPDAGAERTMKKVADWAEARGVPHLDVTDAFLRWAEESDRPPMDLLKDEVHPGVEGSRVIAETLARFFHERQFLNSPKDAAESSR